ncbi:MAG: hypothetical protein JWR52_931 [Marmoricola sp.]|nr:hypothetical protein [Marmoricola sp.]MCW2855316.1 hypothetical protein [Marmoricola sp.]
MGVDDQVTPTEALLARRQLEQLLIERGRAADAKDADAIVTLHVPGSRDTHGIFDGTIEEFAEYLRQNHYSNGRYGTQRHTISNAVIEFDGPLRARVESYHLAYHRLVLDGQNFDVQIGGRYFDVCEKQTGKWLIAERSVIYDWSRSWPVDPRTPDDERAGHR